MLLKQMKRRNFCFCVDSLRVFFQSLAFAFLFISTLEAHQFFLLRGLKQKIPPQGGLEMPANKLFVVLAFRKEPLVLFAPCVLLYQ